MSDVETLQASFVSRGPLAKDSGKVSLIVLRLGDGVHETPEAADVGLETGLVGDRWNIEKDPERVGQVTLMMRAAAEAVAGDKPLHLPGDNFLVDIDLSEDNLPAGTRVRVGGALLEITTEPHLGCGKFSERFGSAAVRWVNNKGTRSQRLRGVNCRVVEPGAVRLGDAVTVVR